MSSARLRAAKTGVAPTQASVYLRFDRILEHGVDVSLLFRRLAILETDVDVGSVDEWRWTGPTTDLGEWCERLDAPDVLRRANSLVE